MRSESFFILALLAGFAASTIAASRKPSTAETSALNWHPVAVRPAYKYGDGADTQKHFRADFFSGDESRNCAATGDRCAGLESMSYVKYAACCDKSASCVKDASYTWGYVCVEVPEHKMKCTEDQGKCAGIKGEEYVPFSSCCGGGLCVVNEKLGSGKFCQTSEVHKYNKGDNETKDDGEAQIASNYKKTNLDALGHDPPIEEHAGFETAASTDTTAKKIHPYHSP